jgi:hypothetical protein
MEEVSYKFSEVSGAPPRRATMCKHHLLTHVLLGLGLLAPANLVPQTFVGAAEAHAPGLVPGTARVWFLRSAGSLNVSHDGMVTANAVAVGIDGVKPPE